MPLQSMTGKPVVLRSLSPSRPGSRPVAPRADIVLQDVGGKTRFSAVPNIGLPSLEPREGAELMMGQVGSFEISGGIGCIVDTTDPSVARVRRPDQPNAHDGQFEVDSDPQVFSVRAIAWGSVMVVVRKKNSRSPLDAEYLQLTVKDPRPTVYKKTNAHNHKPAGGAWNEICADPCNNPQSLSAFDTMYLWGLAKMRASPRTVVNEAKKHGFSGKPIGLAHLEWYLAGSGATINEDRNLENWIRDDSKARQHIVEAIRSAPRPRGSTQVRATMEFSQAMFGNEDYHYAYGTIDFLDILVDYVAGTVKLWFEDCYEWHPPHPLFQPRCPNLKPRSTDFLHAALVQMKLEGAADYWMRGEATFPMSIFPI